MLDLFAPWKNMRCDEELPVWVTKECKQRDVLLRKVKKTDSAINNEIYRRVRNNVVRFCNTHKHDNFKTAFNEAGHDGQSKKNAL